MAADLTLAGHEVRLAALPDHASNIHTAKAIGGIYLEGKTSSGVEPGMARIATITTNVAQAVDGAAVVIVVVPAFAQAGYMEALTRHAQKGQVVVFHPGKFAPLEFRRRMREAGREGDVTIGETTTMLYAAKINGPGHVRIKAVKSEVYFAAFPSIETAGALMTLYDLFPQFTPAQNILQTSLDDIGMVLHPITTLLNSSRIEQMGPYRNAFYDITPSVSRVMERVDEERVRIAREFGCEAPSLLETYEMIYGIRGKTPYEAIRGVDAYKTQMAPDSLMHRYVSEEIPYSLVPTAAIARIAGIATPGIDCIIQLGAMANGIDYWSQGRNLDSMGIHARDIPGVLQYVTTGQSCQATNPEAALPCVCT
jgi:opine dehydrogenase